MNGAIAVDPVGFMAIEMRPTSLQHFFTGSVALIIEGRLWAVKRERNCSLPVFRGEEFRIVDNLRTTTI